MVLSTYFLEDGFDPTYFHATTSNVAQLMVKKN